MGDPGLCFLHRKIKIMNISKDESNFLKGIAIMLMLIHHLFAFPERIIEPSSVIHIFNNINIEKYVGLFGKICVPMFLFLSGYGFSVCGSRKWRYYASKIAIFYKLYWTVFLIFIPIGLFFFKDNIRYHFDLKILLANMVGGSSSYNGEWWFIEPYILLVISMPLINIVRKKTRLLLVTSSVLFMTAYLMIESNIDTPVISATTFLFWQFIFVLGYVYGLNCENEITKKWYLYCVKKRKIITLLSLIVIPLAGFYLTLIGLILITPLFIFLCLEYKNILPDIIYKIVISLGAYSTFMWLTHTFYAYYFAQEIIYYPKYSLLIFFNLLVISYITSRLLTKISKIRLPIISKDREETLIKN
jgi:hypothetical protein